MTYFNDLSGKTFGRLLVIAKTDERKGSSIVWKCQCSCGKTCYKSSQHLVRGLTRSCGCLKKEIISLPYGESSINSLYVSYRRNAEYRKLDFSISKEVFISLTSSKCFYCGKYPSQHHKQGRSNGEYVYNGIDRINNGIGYTEENCVPCCWVCNNAKKDMSIGDFYLWIKDVVSYSNLLTNNKESDIINYVGELSDS